MKAQLQVTEGLQRKINVEIPNDVVKTAFEKVYQTIQRNVEIKGFRKGKVPMTTIKTMYKDRIVGDVAQDLIQAHYPKALKDQQVDPINYPEFEFEDPKENTGFQFAAIFEVRPQVSIKKWEGLEVLKEKFIFNDKQFDQTILNIRSSRSSLINVLEDRASILGDTAILDFEGFVDGKPLENGTGKNHTLELGAKQFIEGFEDGIIGMKIGDTKTLQLQFPSPYHSEELAGKPVEFKVKLNELKKKVLPDLNEELLTQIGNKQTVEEFKTSLRSDIEESEKKRIEDAFKNRLVKNLVLANPVEVPSSLLKDQKAALIEDFKKRMTEQGMPSSDFNAHIENWDSDFTNSAAEMIQSSFLIDKLAADHNLFCMEADLNLKFTEYSKQTGIEESRVKEWYAKPEQMSRLAYMITEEKVIKMITEKASIREVDAKDLKEEKN